MIDRLYKNTLLEMLEIFPVVAVIGPRQVGKSTLVQLPEIQAGRRYISLDDLGQRSVAETDPKSFLGGEESLIVDEVQLVPGLLREIKRLVDIRRTPGRFLLTGSADLDHCADISHVLAGRVGLLRLPPLLLTEKRNGNLWKPLFTVESIEELEKQVRNVSVDSFRWEDLLSGGFPLSVESKSTRGRTHWFDSFQTTYLERDLRRVSDISNLADFVRLMKLSAAETGTLLNQAHLARAAGLKPMTAGRYLSVLEASLLIEKIPPFVTNIGKRFVKSPKLYWTDTGLCAFLNGFTHVDQLKESHTYKGRFFESLVMMEMKGLLPLLEEPASLFHLRTHDQLEIDGLLQVGRRQVLIEVKASQTVTAKDAAPIEKWLTLQPKPGFGVVIYAGTEVFRLSSHVLALPLMSLCSSGS